MMKSKIRIQKNRIKLLLAVALIAIMRRSAVFAAIVTLPAAVLSPGSLLYASAHPDGTAFTDIKGHWAEETITEAAAEGMVSGYGDGTFRPDREISVQEFAAMLTAGLQIPLVAALSIRPDGEPERDLNVKSLQDAGILKEGELPVEESDQGLQRSVMMKLAVRALDPATAAGGQGAMIEKAEAAGLMNSIQEDGQVPLGKTATRAEAVAVIQRLQHLLAP